MERKTVTKFVRLSNIWGNHSIKSKGFTEISLHSDDRGFLDPKYEGLDQSILGTAVDIGTRYLILNDDHAFDKAKFGVFNCDSKTKMVSDYLNRVYPTAYEKK